MTPAWPGETLAAGRRGRRSNESLRASNDALQALNTALRSATAKLETSREALRSHNNDLSTANLGLQGKVDEMGLAYGLLEVRMRNRTAELAQANEALRAEVLDRVLAEEHARALLGRLAGAREDERRSLSRELHDSLGQHMASLGIALKSIGEHTGFSPEMKDQFMRSQSALLRLEDALDRLSHDLRPATLEDLGLQHALLGHLDNWSADTGVKVDFESVGLGEKRLTELLENTVYRVVQEALTNVHKHAGATRVALAVQCRDHALRIIVEDNGRGFDRAAALARGLGLRSMSERARMAGGRLDIESSPGKGTTVYLTLPSPGGRHG